MQLSQLRLAADRPLVLSRRQAVWMLRAHVHRFAAIAKQLFDEVRLAAAATERFVPQNEILVQLEFASNRQEEPFTLADEHLVATSVQLRGFTATCRCSRRTSTGFSTSIAVATVETAAVSGTAATNQWRSS